MTLYTSKSQKRCTIFSISAILKKLQIYVNVSQKLFSENLHIQKEKVFSKETQWLFPIKSNCKVVMAEFRCYHKLLENYFKMLFHTCWEPPCLVSEAVNPRG